MEQFETTSKCAGCKEELNLLTNHIVLTMKTRKLAFVQIAPDPETVDPLKEKTVEDEDENSTVLGARTGVGEELLFHDFNCVSEHFGKDSQKNRKVSLKLNRDGSDPYNDKKEGEDE